MIEIWAPRYKDNTVLIATRKIKNGQNLVQFTKAKHLEGEIFAIDGDKARSCPVESNGKIPCFAVPFKMLENIG